MRMIKRLLLFALFLIVFNPIGEVWAQEETLTLMTYYPAPYGIHVELRANFYRDHEDTPADAISDPDTYYMDLDGRSWLNRLTIDLSPAASPGSHALYVNGIPTASPMDDATSYARRGNASSLGIYSSVYGEAEDVPFTNISGSFIGIYGKCTGTQMRSRNMGVYGKADDSSYRIGPIIINTRDYGVYGRGDEYGVRGRGDQCGGYAYFGDDEGVQTAGLYANATSSDTGRVAHGAYGITRCAPETNDAGQITKFYYGGYFIGTRRGVYAHSNEDIAAYGETDSNDRYGGHFMGHRNLLNTRGGGIEISVEQGESNPEERPEIVNGDRTLTIRTRARDNTDYGRVTVFTRPEKDCLAGVSAKQNADHADPPYIYLKVKPLTVGMGENYKKYIVSSHRMEFRPGMADRDRASYVRIYIKGDVYVGNDLVPGHDYDGDLAELFELKGKEALELGDVVVIDEESEGRLKKSSTAYDSKAAGIISSSEQASMVMGIREDGTEDKPLALAGRVLCKVDAGFGEIKPGDLLATSPTPGYAMKAEPVIEKNGQKIYGQGVILGKALEPLKEGKGKILILVCLM